MEFPEEIFGFPLLAGFSDAQRQTLRRELGKPGAARMRHFESGEKVCAKGDFELDLCLILGGSVDMFDEVAGKGWQRVATLRSGEFYGELGAIGGQPRSTNVVAVEQTDIFYIPRYALKFLEVNAQARQLLADRYRERAVRVTAGQLDLFAQAPPEFIDELIEHCAIERYDLSGITIVKQGEPGDALYIVREGFVKVVHELGDGGQRVLAYLRAGEYFGEMALLESAVRYASVLTAGLCELIRIRREEFLSLCAMRPQVEAAVRAVIALRREQEQRITPEISDLLERSGQLGLIQAEAPLVMDLDLCVKCDNCVKACETLHGESRLIRNGIQLDKYLVPSACRHCDDPKCMNSCPTGAIKRRPGGEIYFEYDRCIGCGNCAIACPYDNIAMIDTPSFDQAQARKSQIVRGHEFFRPYPLAAHNATPALWHRLFGAAAPAHVAAAPATEAHVPPAFPIKCDLCDGLPFMGCVHNCPTGAAIRLDPAQLFASTGALAAGSRVHKARHAGDAAKASAADTLIMESVRRRPPTRIPPSIALVLTVGLAVVIAHTATTGVAARLGPYRTGLYTLALFGAAAYYGLRKRAMWLTLRPLRAAEVVLPAPLWRWLVALDRLETSRRIHLAIGVLSALPLWWHLQTGRMNAAEALLAATVVLLLGSGVLGVVIQHSVPRRSRTADFLVRSQDVENAINELYVEAEEKILGHSEDLIQAYRRSVRPILRLRQPGLRMFRAMMTGFDPAQVALRRARAEKPTVADAAIFEELLELARKKLRLDLNEFELWFSTAWLRVHIALVMLFALLLSFHILSVLYFAGA